MKKLELIQRYEKVIVTIGHKIELLSGQKFTSIYNYYNKFFFNLFETNKISSL